MSDSEQEFSAAGNDPEGSGRASPSRDDTAWSGDSWSEAREGSRDAGPLPGFVGPYRVVGRLGTGGMGEVFLAVDETLNRRIAVKRIRPDCRKVAEFQRRFEVEARVTARLQHPAIIAVYRYEDSSDGIFYTMRPVEGETLLQLLVRLRAGSSATREDWPTARVVRLFLQAANAVAYAHSRGVIHRDLKPANIIIGPFEEVLVLDWGLARVRDTGEIDAEARAFDDADGLLLETGSRAVVGTPAYSAPEVLESAAADERSDVFSLGVILYELLALRRPWTTERMAELREAMKTPPDLPTLVQPGRRIPAELGEVALRALEHEPQRRFASVGEFAHQVAQALEGRASWQLRSEALERDRWRLSNGRLQPLADGLSLRSRGREGLRYFCLQRFTDNVRLEFDLRMPKGQHEVSVWFNANPSPVDDITAGYALAVVAGRRRTLSLHRSGRDVTGSKAPTYEPRRWYHVVATRAGDRLSLHVDGDEVYAYNDAVPLTGGYLGLTGRTQGIEIDALRVFSRGTDVTVSCLSIPDAFFNRGLFEAARAEYEKVTASHPGRTEGDVARYRAGMCMLELHKREPDAELQSLLLDEALDAFTDQDRINTCLADLGRAIVAGSRGLPHKKHDALSRALTSHARDPHISVVVEWILGQLHAVGDDKRQTVAELLPLAVDHCMEHWGKRVILDLLRRVRAEWETPSFVSGRSRFKENDEISRAEAKLFCGFWVGRAELVHGAMRRLLEVGLMRPHHVGDAVYTLLALDRPDSARDLLERIEHIASRTEAGPYGRALCLASVALHAGAGELDQAESTLRDVELDPTDRGCNAARLWLARAHFEHGQARRAQRALRHLGRRDFFAHEHLAWFHLLDGDLDRAKTELRPLVERKDHLAGRNLTNFLHGVCLLGSDRAESAQRVFGALRPIRWPRTWTLGSYYATDRLGEGSLDSYLAGAFAWERRTLEAHRALLDKVRGRLYRPNA